MAAGTYAKVQAALARIEESLQQRRFTVLIWAPGDAFFTKKRADIAQQLKEQGFDAFTSEELSDHVPSSLPLLYQELSHWQAVDVVVVLEAGIAPAMEVAAYALQPGFCERCIVFHPRDYLTHERTSYPGEILKLFPNRVIYSPQEMQDCTIIAECLHRVTAWRRCSALRRYAPL